MFEYEGIHKCTWHPDTLGHSYMIDFVVVSFDLRPRVSDTRVKREVALSNDHHLVVSLIHWMVAGQTWQAQTYNEHLLGTSGGTLCRWGF